MKYISAFQMISGIIVISKKDGDRQVICDKKDHYEIGWMTAGAFSNTLLYDGDKVTVKGDGNYPVATVIVTDKTLLIDGKDGDLKGDRALKKGRKVTAYYSSKMTRSYPPQAEGFAIVFGKNNEKQGKYMHVEKVTPSENGESVRLLNSNRDIIVTVSKDVYEDYQNIKEGDRIMAWYSIMTMSLPGQTNATKVIVLP